MSLSVVQIQHHLEFLERHVSTLMQVVAVGQPDAAQDLTKLGCIWRLEVEELHAVHLCEDSAFFKKREQIVTKRKDK
jgi:hypothetical protein